MTRKRPHILLVEDNHADVVLLMEAFRANGFACDITVASDGSRALELLAEPPPDLIILDLNLPKISGVTVLSEVRKNSQFAGVPVIVFSTSKAERDITEAQRAGSDRYLSKATDFDGTVELAREIERFLHQAPVSS